MKSRNLTQLIIIGLLAFAVGARASVTVTPANATLSADAAANAPGSAWTTLGNIVITEGHNGDFGAGTGVTLVLKAPTGYQFNTGGTPSVSFAAGKAITAASIAVTDSATLTVTLTVSGSSSSDVLTLSNIQAQATAGAPIATSLHIYRPSTGGGTASINGINTSSDGSSGTSFGQLTESVGNATQLAFTTQPAGATAGSAFTTQPVVKTEDQFGNASTNGLPSSLFVTVALTSGTGPLQGTASLNIGTGTGAGKGTVTYSGLRIDVAGGNDQLTVTTTNGLASDQSSVFSVSPSTPSVLTLLTQPSSTATAGVIFSQQPVVQVQDAFGNLCSTTVSASRLAGSGTLEGTTNVATVNGVATYTDLANPAISTITIKFTAGSASVTSGNIVVSAGPYSQLLVLLPGETAAPGTSTGKTGTPTAQTAGTAFSAKVIAVDQGFNQVTSVTDVVGLTSSDANAALPANVSLINGTNSLSVTLKTAGSQTVTATDITDNTKAPAQSSAVTVNTGSFTKLQLLMPGETASPGSATGKTGTPTAETAGTAFTVTVNAVDANWNLVSSFDNISITSSDANATLPGSANLAGGTKTFSVTFKTAGTATVTATDNSNGARTPNTSPSTTVNVGAFTKLQILAPGETAAPGTGTGKTGTPTAQTADTAVTMTVNAVDANWNVVNTVSDTVAITCTDTNAVLPANAALASGTQTFSVNFNTAGTRTVTATDATDGSKTASTSANITVNAGAFAKLQLLMPGETAVAGTATGKTGTPTAQTAGTSFTVTVNAVDASWNLVSSTHTVGITSSDASAILPANASLFAGTKNFTVTLKSEGGQTVTATDISDGTKTPNTGTTTTVNPAAASKLVITTQPSSAAVAGTAFAVQPVIYIEDQYNNVRSNDTLTVTAARSGGSGTLAGTTGVAAVGGIATFSNLSMPLAGTITIQFTSGALTSATSGNIVVSAGPFSQLQVLLPGETAAPGTSTGKTGTPTAQTAGTAFTITVNAVDANWNLINTVTDTAGIGLSDTNATAPGAAALVAGTKTFSVTPKTAGSLTVTASDSTDGTKNPGVSSSVTVNAGSFTKLQLLMPGETAAAGSATGKTGTPTAQAAGTAFNVTVNAVDANWNLVSSLDNISITSSDANATLPASADLNGGSKTFSVTFKTAGSSTVTATDNSNGSRTPNTSPSTTVNAGVFAKLQILAPGETAAPGTASGKTGTPTAQNADTAVNMTVNAVDANWNLVSTAGDTIAITSSDPNATLPANAALASGTQTFAVNFNTAGSRTVTATDATDGTKTANTSAAITVNAGAIAKLQVLMPGETAAPGTVSGKTGTPTAQTAGTAVTVTINAVDASWNVVSTNDTVAITSSDANAALPVNAALSSGTKTFSVTFKTVGSWTVTASDVTHGTTAAGTGAATAANAGAFTQLQLLMPGETAAPGTSTGKTGTPTAQTAGVAFNVTVNAVDANWNSISTNDTVSITSSDANAVLPSNAALVGGTKSFSVTLKTAGSKTVTASDTTHSTKTASTGSATTISPAAFSQLQVLLPGETASPGSATGKTGTPTAETSATAFNVTVNAVDAFWNLVNTANDTVDISSTDTNATPPVDSALVAGTKTFSVTLITAANATITATDVTDGTKGSGTSASVAVNAGAFVKLQLLMPGETAVQGTASGKTGTPTAQTAGTAFTVTVRSVDANWNLASSTDTIKITSSDANATLPANAALVAGTKTFSVTAKTAGSWTVTATDNSNGAKTANTSPATTVNPGAFAKLQILAPGETAAPGTTTGRTGTPTAQITDTPATLTVNAVDANWNLVNTAVDTVAISSSDANATLPANAALVSGTKNFSVKFNTAGSRTATATDVTDGSKTANTSSSMTVNAGAFAKLQILLPGETSAPGTTSGKTGTPTAQAAGTAFNATVNAVDATWNIVNTNDTVAISLADPNATAPANAALVAGTKAFSTTFKTAGNWTATASDVTNPGIPSNASASVAINAGALAKLQILMPGETAAPGTATGKTGTPTGQTAGSAFAVTVRSVDANWNLVSTNDTIQITSSDANATLPASSALAAGSQSFNVTLAAAGTATVTASDVTHGTVTASTGASISVTPGPFSKLQILLPGETAAPGTPLGKTGSATAQAVGVAFNITVKSTDANWNPVTSSDVIDITSTDSHAVLPADAALVGGAQTFALTLKTAGSRLALATDISNGGIGAGSSSSITVNKGPQTITFTNLTFHTYGDAPFAIGATSSSGLPVSFNVTAGPATMSNSFVVINGAGSVTVEASQAGDSNYNAATNVDQSFTVAKAVLTVAPNNATKVYGAALPVLSASYIGFVNGDTTNLLAGSPALNTTATVGSSVAGSPYPITASQGTLSAANYTFTYFPGSLTVTAAPLTVSAADASRLVGAANPTFTGTITGLQNGDSVTATYGTTADTNSPIGNYPITPTLVDTNSVLGNYAVTANNGILSVNGYPAKWASVAGGNDHYYQPIFAPRGISWDDARSAAVASGGYLATLASADENSFAAGLVTNTNYWIFSAGQGYGPWIGASQPANAPDPATGWAWVSGEPFSYANWAPGQPASGMPGVENGIQLASATTAVDALWDDQTSTNTSLVAAYLVEYDTNPFKSNQTIAFGPIGDMTYGDGPYTLKASASSGLAISYSVVSGPATILGNQVSPTGAGTVTVRASQAGNADYFAAADVEQTFNVMPAQLSVTADAASRNYGDLNPKFTGTITGLQKGDNITATYSTTADVTSPVGTYAITPGLVDPDGLLTNYTVTLNNSMLTIAPASLTVTAGNGSRNYGAADPTLTVSLKGVQNGDNLSGSYGIGATSASPVGSYPVIPTLVDPSGVSSNYNVTLVNGTLTVNRAPLSVTANSTSRTYGAANPALTGSLVGVVNGDNINAVYSCSADTNSPVGNYDIIASLIDLDGKLGNYSVSTVNGTLAVTPASLLVGAQDASRAYGQTNPVFGAVYVGLVNGENAGVLGGMPAFSTLADTNSPIGTYDIDISQGTLSNANYSLAFTNATLTVTAAQLTITADNQSRTYGTTNPNLTVSYSGFVNGDDASMLGGAPNVSTAADQSTGVGTYPIVVGQGTISNTNYALVLVNGTLTINPAALSVTAADATRTYGAANPIFGGNLTGVQNGDNITATYNTTADVTSSVGAYAITPTLVDPNGLLANYAVTQANGTLTITPASLTITADNAVRLYGDVNPTFTGNITGIQNNDNLNATYGTVAAPGSPVGTYDIVPVLVDPSGVSSNYTVTLVNGTLTVNRAPLSVTANSTSRTYGAANPALTGSLVGVVNGDNINAVYSCAADTNSPVGNYDIIASLIDLDGKLGNYSVTTANGTLTVTPASLLVGAQDASRAYGQTNPVFGAVYVGLVNGENAGVLGGMPAFSTLADTNSPIGAYDIDISQGTLSNANYSLAFTNATLTVTAAQLTITADNQSRTYGTTNSSLTVSYSGFVNGDDASMLGGAPNVSTAADQSTGVGTYPIVVGQGTISNTNYALVLVNGTLTINPAALSVTAADATRTYGAANPAFTGNLTGVQNGDNITATYNTTANVTSSVGAYTITPTLVDPNGLLANYAVTQANGTLTITPAPLTITADNAVRLYGDVNPTFTGNINGIQNSDDLNATYGTVAAPGSPVGTYAIVPTLVDPSGVSSNYNVTLVNGTLTVNQVPLSVTANSTSRTYGAANPALTGSLVGVVNGDNINAVYSCSADTNSPVGNYDIIASLIDLGGKLGNYSVSTANGTLTVTPASLLVGAQDASRAYGQTNPVFGAVYVGLVNGENAGVLGGMAAFSTLADTNSPIGAYDIDISQGTLSNANYSLNFTNATLTVTAAQLTITADNQSRTYGTTNSSLTVSYSGFVNGDDASMLGGAPNVSTAADQSTGVGTYPIVVDQGTISNTNYALVLVNGTLTINPAALSVTAADATRTYGAANPTFTGNLTGVQNGDTITATYNTTANVTSSVGAYAITPTLLDPNGLLANYTVTQANGTLTITPASLTITADNAVRLYGDVNPTFTGNITGIQNNDNLSATYATAATPGSPVGTYAIVPTLVDPSGISSNYNVTLVNGTLTVNQAPLSVTANSTSRTYGAANPALTGSLVGVVNGDNINAVYSCAADTNSPVGNYDIIASLIDLDGKLGNYSVTTVNGTLTVTPASLLVGAQDASRAYGQTNPVFGAVYVGLVNGENAGVLGGMPAFSTLADTNSPIGAYDIDISQGTLSNANYSLNFTNATLTVTAAQLTITADNQSRTYGTTNPSLTVSYSGFVNGDDASALGGNPSVTTSADQTSGVGSYPIVAGQGTIANTNYALVFANGTLTINPAALSVTAADATRTYGAANPTFTGNLTGVQNGDNITATYGTSAKVTSPVGAYSIEPKLMDPDGLLANYTVTTANGTLTITPADLTVTAGSATRTYGAANPILSVTVDGIQNGDDLSGSYNVAATPASPVGDYVVTPTLVDPSGVSGNYNVTLVNGTLTITPASLLVIADDGNRGYGAANPAFTGKIAGIQNGDDLSATYATIATPASAVGSYPITPTLIDPDNLAGNYNIVLQNGTLAVTAVPLTIKADDASRTFGAANPAFTGTITGLVNGDNISATYGTPATAASPAGTYPIIPTMVDGQGKAGNYVVSIVNGTLTVSAPQQPPVVQPLLAAGDGSITITWTALSNVTYRVQYQTDIGSSGWSDLTADITATNGTASFTDHPGAVSHRFYRIKMVP